MLSREVMAMVERMFFMMVSIDMKTARAVGLGNECGGGVVVFFSIAEEKLNGRGESYYCF